MPSSQAVTIPEGDLIEYEDGTLIIGDRPIIGCLRGDGIGIDITPVMQNVVQAAVDKAYGDKRKLVWCPVHAGLEGLQHSGRELPDGTLETLQVLKVAIRGPFTTPTGDESHVCLHCAGGQSHPGRCEGCGQDDGVCDASGSLHLRLRQQLGLRPWARPVRCFDGVLALPHAVGDDLSGAALALGGAPGLAPGADLSETVALFGAMHDAAPGPAGQDGANPSSLILSAAMMLEHLGWDEPARLLVRSLERALAEGHVTRDWAEFLRHAGRPKVTELSCSGFGQALIDRM